MTGTAFDTWLDVAVPGQEFEYHIGFLPRERAVAWQPSALVPRDAAAYRVAVAKADKVDAEADAAWQSHQRDEVFLTQRKLNFLVYSYLATRRETRLKNG